ncbi:MAG: histidine triad nucleotide-binding protein [Gammaproteobacteria bacterium TMED159]|nr:MAG: histidine triad nucleotide-binding protein [Gammaproteobacteria bacterium TMED159]RCL40324.1 MAG: histidine triad nucleotide-binding protein [Gammaproteobacteria bacterium]|tara:strand:+ start:390 stop:734 length:345 start_codon:yes stop_codon:yes gene_type:complete
MTKTIFQKIIDREVPSKILFEDDKCIVIEDIAPKAPTHLLVIPKKPIKKLSEVKPDDKNLLGHLMIVISEITKQLNIEDAFNIIINNGEEAGQTVFHLHIHILAGKNFSEFFPG